MSTSAFLATSIGVHLEDGTSKFTVDLRNFLPSKPDGVVPVFNEDGSPFYAVSGWDLTVTLGAPFVVDGTPSDLPNYGVSPSFIFTNAVKRVV